MQRYNELYDPYTGALEPDEEGAYVLYADANTGIARLQALLAEERANAKMLLEVVRGQIVTMELQREMLRKCEETQNGG